MTIATTRFFSAALRRQTTYTVILPEPSVGPGPYPVLFQLHGASDDHVAWIQRANLARHVERLGLIVVLPDGGLSYWANLGPRERYEDFLVDDLTDHLARTFPVRQDKAAIGGLSMGGFGAVYLGLRHPDLFASVWAHSGPFRSGDLGELERTHAARLLEELHAAVDAADPENMPVLALDCGVDDALLDGNREFHHRLCGLELPHTYLEFPGAHTWSYWDAHVVEALAQHVTVLGLPPAVF